jgi:hypothetical protein
MIEELLRAALNDAGVPEHTAVLLLVPGYREGATEYAYLPPGGGPYEGFEHHVLYDAEPRLHDFSDFHRFLAYADANVATSALAVGLRHEAEHAAIWNYYGHPFGELESILRKAMRDTGHSADYTQIPSEIAANRAADVYARARYPDDVEALAANDRTQQFVRPGTPVDDLVGATAAMIWNYVDPNAADDHDADRRSFSVVVPELEQRARDWLPIDPRYWSGRPDGVGLVVPIDG